MLPPRISIASPVMLLVEDHESRVDHSVPAIPVSPFTDVLMPLLVK